MPAGSRALLVARQDDVARKLSDRECEVLAVASVGDALSGGGADAPFDVVIVADGFDDLTDPVNDLRELAKLLAEDGQLIVVAANATHAEARLQALRGVVTGRRYDLVALERVLSDAGFAPSERLRVIEPVAAADLDAIASGLSGLMASGDAETVAYVLLARRGESAPAQESIAEAMQRTVAALTAEVAELRAVKAALADAEATIADQAGELQARHDALVERIELVERLYAERRHLELEIVVKDDYISILRRDRNEWRNIHAALQNDMDELKRSRHYKVAAGMHAALTRIPVVHHVARFAARRLMALRGRNA